MADVLTRDERDELVRRIRALEGRLYPPPEAVQPSPRERELLRESYYVALGEYFDRLPRVLMSICPFTGGALRRAWDPWGLDGFWWHQRLLAKIDEPTTPSTFKVLLGSLSLAGRVPTEAVETVTPGPDVPFVVPRLLELPGMIAVVHRLALETGDAAHTIAYFSEEEMNPALMHQHWLRADLWFKDEDGNASWIIANDAWDFDLAPYVTAGSMRWIADVPDGPVVTGATNGDRCPYVGLPGERRPQVIADGQTELTDPPTGEPFNPFAETGDGEGEGSL